VSDVSTPTPDARAAAEKHAAVLAGSITVPAFFAKLAAEGELPAALSAEQAARYRRLGDKVVHAVKQAYDRLYAPYATHDQALAAAGLVDRPAPPAPAPEPWAADPAVKAAALALATAQ
jgi:hypothetical protein